MLLNKACDSDIVIGTVRLPMEETKGATVWNEKALLNGAKVKLKI